MKTVRYLGDYEGWNALAPRVTWMPGGQVEIDDDVAAALVEQGGGFFEVVDAGKRKSTAPASEAVSSDTEAQPAPSAD